MMSDLIRLRGVRVHNLKSVDLDLPKKKLIGFCGPSGSGKSSLAIDTLFAEGHRRYLDTFSLAEKGLFDQPEKPDADEIESVPPALAILRSNARLTDRATVGTMTEISHLVRLALAQFGELVCPRCQVAIQADHPESVTKLLAVNHDGQQVMIGFEWSRKDSIYPEIQDLVANGFLRAACNGQTIRIESLLSSSESEETISVPENLMVLVDRLRVSSDSLRRIRESVELSFQMGNASCFIICPPETCDGNFHSIDLDEKQYAIRFFSNESSCHGCGNGYSKLAANELSFNSPVSACKRCTGLGKLSGFTANCLVSNPKLTFADGAIAVLQNPLIAELVERAHESLADWWDMSFADAMRVSEGKVEQIVVGLFEEYYSDLTQKKARALLESLRGQVVCPDCDGTRLNEKALCHQLGGQHLGDISRMTVGDLKDFLDENSGWDSVKSEPFLYEEIESRLEYLNRVGLSYLTLDREVNSLSTGERQRVSMTNALGSKLVNMLYIFDEPCSGLHPQDVGGLIDALKSLSAQGNSVIAVDHDLSLMKQVDHIAEFGPGAGSYGGEVIYSGDSHGFKDCKQSVTVPYLSGTKSLVNTGHRRPGNQDCLIVKNARGNNLKNVAVEFPLGMLCVVTGVSGSGKSSLVVDTLYPAISRMHHPVSPPGLPVDDVEGVDAIDDVVLIDQSPLGAASRSNPATYCKAFDEIRTVFAETVEAKAHNIKAGRFSFNTDGGRCDACKGEGTKQIDMKFMADLRVKCKFCKGLRYKREILNCRYRGQNISEVLEMTVKEAFTFFRGKKKLQSRLKPLIDVGLEYLRLGQPASTLSSGEAQRLRLAGFLAAGRKTRTLFLMDEPTVGLHYCDVAKLLDCFDAILSEGHSIILVEHNKMVMCAADHIVDLGPSAGEHGGKIVVTGSPEEVSQHPLSKTGNVLKTLLNNS